MSYQFGAIKSMFYPLIYLASLGTIAISMLTFIYSKTWFFDLFANFRFHYFLILLLLGSLLLFGHRYKFALLCYTFAVINFIPIAPYFLPNQIGSKHTNQTIVRIMTLNVLKTNWRYNLIRDAILKNKPDILLLVEVDKYKLRKIAAIKKILPYFRYDANNHGYGIAMYSKYPFDKSIRLKTPKPGQRPPSYLASFQIANKTLHVIGLHADSPVTINEFHKRNHELSKLAKIISKLPSPKILIGDLNTTPWSFYFRKLLKESSLHDSMKGYGVSSTWRNKYTRLTLPIDHILYSKGLVVKQRRVGNNIGSDHYPLIVDFYLS